MKLGEWTLITSKLSDKWWHLLDEDTDSIHPGQWIGLYVGEEGDPRLWSNAQMNLLPLNGNYNG